MQNNDIKLINLQSGGIGVSLHFFKGEEQANAFIMDDRGNQTIYYPNGSVIIWPTIFFRTPLNKNRTNPK
jgi:hypothetical protein